jgi:hypothetical protein
VVLAVCSRDLDGFEAVVDGAIPALELFIVQRRGIMDGYDS